jgi:hypothetical protein
LGWLVPKDRAGHGTSWAWARWVCGPAEGSRWVVLGAILLRVRRARARCFRRGGLLGVCR